MRVIIAGSRKGVSIEDVEAAIKFARVGVMTTVLCGMADGADMCGRFIAKQNGWEVEEYPADWAKYGKAAGFKRNVEMAGKADALIAVWDGQSRGTVHMIETAEKLGLLVHVYKVVR